MENPIKWLIDDVKNDIQTIKDIKNKKAKLISWKELDFAGALKTYWPWFLLLIAAFCAGLFLGSIMAHNHYIEIIEDKCPQAFGLNETQEQIRMSEINYQQYISKNTNIKGFIYEREN